MRRRPRPHPRARPVGVWHKRPSVAPTPPRASAVSHAGRLDRQQLPHTRQPGGQAGTATLRRVRAAEKPPRAPGRLVYQPAPEERVESVDAAHLAVNACANAPIGGVGSSARVPPVRRRGEAAPLGRAWLGWGSCLEDRASGASAVPPDPKVDDRASAFLPEGISPEAATGSATTRLGKPRISTNIVERAGASAAANPPPGAPPPLPAHLSAPLAPG